MTDSDQPDGPSRNEGFEGEGPDLAPENVLTIDDDRYASDRVCLVTGAASGIGRAVTLAMAENGLTVLGTDVDEDGLAETAALADEWGLDGAVETVAGDLRDDDDVERIVDDAADRGSLAYLANVAGMQHVDPIEEFPMEQFDRMYDVMLRAPVYLSKLAVPHMRDAGGGVVANMASVHGHYVTSDKVAYNVVKFGLRGLTQSIAAEYESTGVRAFSVSTGYVATPLVTNQIPDTAEQRGITEREVVEDVMLGQSRVERMMSPVEVANLFVFGCSTHGRHLNGGDLPWDGGMLTTYD